MELKNNKVLSLLILINFTDMLRNLIAMPLNLAAMPPNFTAIPPNLTAMPPNLTFYLTLRAQLLQQQHNSVRKT